jgi:hypothetical protein
MDCKNGYFIPSAVGCTHGWSYFALSGLYNVFLGWVLGIRANLQSFWGGFWCWGLGQSAIRNRQSVILKRGFRVWVLGIRGNLQSAIRNLKERFLGLGFGD